MARSRTQRKQIPSKQLANSEYHKIQQSGIPDKDNEATDDADLILLN